MCTTGRAGQGSHRCLVAHAAARLAGAHTDSSLGFPGLPHTHALIFPSLKLRCPDLVTTPGQGCGIPARGSPEQCISNFTVQTSPLGSCNVRFLIQWIWVEAESVCLTSSRMLLQLLL